MLAGSERNQQERLNMETKLNTTTGEHSGGSLCSDVLYRGINRRGYCAYCAHGMEARDSMEWAPECNGCKWTNDKPNWEPMPDFDILPNNALSNSHEN